MEYRETIFGRAPWHVPGIEVADCLSPNEILVAAGLDWTVEKQSILTSKGREIPNKKALVRSTDNFVLDIVGEDWEPCQNSTAFKFFDEFCKRGHMQMEAAGSMENGRMVWALAKINESFDLFGEDKIKPYILFSNPHKFGTSINIRFLPIRFACQNILTMRSSNAIKLIHYKQDFDDTLKSVQKIMGMAQTNFYSFRDSAETLGNHRYGEAQLFEYLDNLFPVRSERKENESLYPDALSNTSRKIHALVETQPGHQFRPGSWWNAFNAVTYFTDHQRGNSVEARLASAWYGKSKALKVKALKEALRYCMAV